MEGLRAVWVLLAFLSWASAAPPTPSDAKRSGEDIQFGNQQNPPVSLLDDNAMGGAFPSSENTEELPTPLAETQKEPTRVEEQGLKEQKEQQQTQEEEEAQKGERVKEEVKEGERHEGGETRLEEEEDGWNDESNLWDNQPATAHDFYRSYLPHIITTGSLPSLASRRRRSPNNSPHFPPLRSHPIKGGTLAGMRTLLGGQQRSKRDLRRFRRDLNMNGVDLDRLLKNVDMKELMALLSRPQHRQDGYGTVHYAPTPPRYVPQTNMFPDYGEEWGEAAEDLRQNQANEGGLMPAGRVWRKSSAPPGYGLGRVPGFKRSSFRALQEPQPQITGPYTLLNAHDFYSLASMLGVERPQFNQRMRRAVM